VRDLYYQIKYRLYFTYYIYIYIYHSTNDVRHINHTISDVSSACNLMWSTAERRYDRASVQ
jgi:hypothetical protein